MYSTLPSWPVLYFYTGAIAFVLAAFLMPAAIALLRRYRILDRVTAEKIHTLPTPRGGGIVIFLAFAVAVLLPDYRDNPMKGVMIGSLICLIVGGIDDLRGGVPAVIKLAALTWATLVMSLFGVQLKLFGFFPLDLFVTWLWIVGVTVSMFSMSAWTRDVTKPMSTGLAGMVPSYKSRALRRARSAKPRPVQNQLVSPRILCHAPPGVQPRHPHA